MPKKNTLNNIIMRNNRNSPVYQTVITDLVIAGAIPASKGEMLLGYAIPEYLRAPDGTHLTRTAAQSKPSEAKSGRASSTVAK